MQKMERVIQSGMFWSVHNRFRLRFLTFCNQDSHYNKHLCAGNGNLIPFPRHIHLPQFQPYKRSAYQALSETGNVFGNSVKFPVIHPFSMFKTSCLTSQLIIHGMYRPKGPPSTNLNRGLTLNWILRSLLNPKIERIKRQSIFELMRFRIYSKRPKSWKDLYSNKVELLY